MGIDENKDVMRRIMDEVINGQDLAAADVLYGDEHVLHPEASGVGRGPGGMKEAFAGLHADYPDVGVEIDSMVAEGDMVAVRLTFRGTHAATGVREEWREMVFTRFAAGKAAESWELLDTGEG